MKANSMRLLHAIRVMRLVEQKGIARTAVDGFVGRTGLAVRLFWNGWDGPHFDETDLSDDVVRELGLRLR